MRWTETLVPAIGGRNPKVYGDLIISVPII